jgi:dTDP-L-rhamnose 4-epimerase
MKVLITGGAGFIGSHLVDRCFRDGFSVRVLDSLDPRVHPRGRPSYLPSTIEFIQGDVTDRDTLLNALRDIDIVSHQAAYQDYMPDFSRFVQVNSVSTSLIYELIVQYKLPIRKVIVASSQAVYGEGQYECVQHGVFLPLPRSHQQLSRGEWEVLCPDCGNRAHPCLLQEQHTNPYNQYAVSKLAEEKIALGLGWIYGSPSVALRYSITQGPRQSLFNQYSGLARIFVGRALRGEPLIVYEDGLQTRDFIHVQDVIDANMRVLESDADFKAFNVGSGTAMTVLQYAKLLLSKLHLSPELVIPGEYRRGDNRHSVSSVEKLQRLGWRPRRELSDILDDFLCWVESIGGVPAQLSDAVSDMRSAGVVLETQAAVRA